MLEAVSRDNGEALEYASDELKNDKEVVLKAVGKGKEGDALKYASDEQVDEIKKLKNNDKYYYKEDVVAKSAYDYQIDEQIKVLIPGDKEVDLLEFSPIVKAFSRSSKYTSKLIYYSEI